MPSESENETTRPRQRATYACATLPSPVGRLTLVATPDSLVAVLWEQDDLRRVRLEASTLRAQDDHPLLQLAAAQLREYFAGTRRAFTVPLHFAGTDFQRKVWHALLSIPFGETRTYGDIAREIRAPRAVRAVGAANGRNPLSILAPCHRVIGASGELSGFAGGLPAKRYLLGHEGSPA